MPDGVYNAAAANTGTGQTRKALRLERYNTFDGIKTLGSSAGIGYIILVLVCQAASLLCCRQRKANGVALEAEFVEGSTCDQATEGPYQHLERLRLVVRVPAQTHLNYSQRNC